MELLPNIGIISMHWVISKKAPCDMLTLLGAILLYPIYCKMESKLSILKPFLEVLIFLFSYELESSWKMSGIIFRFKRSWPPILNFFHQVQCCRYYGIACECVLSLNHSNHARAQRAQDSSFLQQSFVFSASFLTLKRMRASSC